MSGMSGLALAAVILLLAAAAAAVYLRSHRKHVKKDDGDARASAPHWQPSADADQSDRVRRRGTAGKRAPEILHDY